NEAAAPAVNIALKASMAGHAAEAALVPASLRVRESADTQATARRTAARKLSRAVPARGEALIARQGARQGDNNLTFKTPDQSALTAVMPVARDRRWNHKAPELTAVNANLIQETAAPQFQLLMRMTQFDETGVP